MEHPGEPTAALFGRRVLGRKRIRQRQSNEDAGKATAHERLISKRCKSCQTLYQSAMRTAALAALEKVPSISERDVTGFQIYRAPDGTYGGLFRLNAHGRLVLDSFSVERRGSLLFVFINGRPITELQVDRRVLDGKIYIASGLNSNEIELMKKDWPPSAPK
jgi:hypothetical protein